MAINERSQTFTSQGAASSARVMVTGTADWSATHPGSSDPSGVIGVSQEDRNDGQQVSVQVEGIAYVEAGGTCTRGKLARVLADGKVEDVRVNATPAEQVYVGQFVESGTNGGLVQIEIRVGQVVR